MDGKGERRYEGGGSRNQGDDVQAIRAPLDISKFHTFYLVRKRAPAGNRVGSGKAAIPSQPPRQPPAARLKRTAVIATLGPAPRLCRPAMRRCS
ncbi:hypothetical protein GCM10010160_69900 [Acrocarpospora corrugata]